MSPCILSPSQCLLPKRTESSPENLQVKVGQRQLLVVIFMIFHDFEKLLSGFSYINKFLIVKVQHKNFLFLNFKPITSVLRFPGINFLENFSLLLNFLIFQGIFDYFSGSKNQQCFRKITRIKSDVLTILRCLDREKSTLSGNVIFRDRFLFYDAKVSWLTQQPLPQSFFLLLGMKVYLFKLSVVILLYIIITYHKTSMAKQNQVNSKKNTKKRGGKINKAKKNKKKRYSRKRTVHWTQEQIIYHYISNLKYAVKYNAKKLSWEKRKPNKNFFRYIEDKMKRFIGTNGRKSTQIQSRDAWLKLQHYKSAQQSKKMDIADHSYCNLMVYLQKAKGRQIDDEEQVLRIDRVSEVLRQYQSLLSKKNWPNPWESHRHHLFPQQKQENELIQDQNPPASVPMSQEEFRFHMGMKYLKRREYLCSHLRRVSMKEFKKFPNDDYGEEEDGHGDEDSEGESGPIEDKGKHLKKLAKRKVELQGNPRKKREE